MRRSRVRIEIVRADLKIHQMKGVKGRRLDDRHVFCRLQRWASHYRAGAGPNEGHSLANALTNDGQQVKVIERFEQPKGVSPTNEDGLRFLYRAFGVR